MFIEKVRIAVRISQIGHDPADGFVCLAVDRTILTEPHTVLELLNAAVRVIPFIRGEDGAVIFLTRLNLDWVMPAERVKADLILPPSSIPCREEPVVLQFLNGATIDGWIQTGQPMGRGRTSDFLNGREDFYPVRTRLGMLLVNKSRVAETRLSVTSASLGTPPPRTSPPPPPLAA
jgi:hypothetical protein